MQVGDSRVSAVPLEMTKACVVDAVQWGKDFAQGVIKSLQTRFFGYEAWPDLHWLLSRESVTSQMVPKHGLSDLASHFDVEVSIFEDEWLFLRPILASRIPPDDAGIPAFRNALAKNLAVVPPYDRGKLHGALVTGLLTIGSAAQLERDMKGLRGLFHNETEKLSTDCLAKQIRISLNHKERNAGIKVLSIQALEEWQSSQDQTPGHGEARIRRSDFGGSRKRKRQCIDMHLTENDISVLSERLVISLQSLQLPCEFDGQDEIVGNFALDFG